MEKLRQTEHPRPHPCLRKSHKSHSALIAKTYTRFPPHSKPHPTTAGSSRADVKCITDRQLWTEKLASEPPENTAQDSEVTQ